jgi:hypothetical protein
MKKIIIILSFRELSSHKIQYWLIGIVACLTFSYSQTLGDLNQDGLININDILREVNIILEIPPIPSEYEILVGDLNVDDEINLSDIIITADIIIDNLVGYCTNDQWDYPCENNYSECCYPITSHDFTWEFDTLGAQGSYLTGVSVIDEGNIWVSGKIRLPDSTEWSGYKTYNIANWDGTEWQLYDQELPLVNLSGTTSWHVFPTLLIHAFNENDIWTQNSFASFGHWNGIDWQGYSHIVEDIGLRYKMWGANYDDLWFVGSVGNITYFDGDTLVDYEDPPSITHDLRDIWGISPDKIWAVGYTTFPFAETILMGYDGENWNAIHISNGYDTCDGESLCDFTGGVWAFGDTLYVASAQNGIWKESVSTGVGSMMDEPADYIWGSYMGLRGNHYNDIFSISKKCYLNHFNGENWTYSDALREPFDPIRPPEQYGLEVKGDFVVLVGISYVTEDDITSGRAWVARGHRN